MEEGFLGPRCILQFPFHRFQFVPIIWPFRRPPGNPHQTFEDPGYSANNKRGTITAFVEFVEGVVNTTCNITTPVPKVRRKALNLHETPKLLHSVMHLVTTNSPCGIASTGKTILYLQATSIDQATSCTDGIKKKKKKSLHKQ